MSNGGHQRSSQGVATLVPILERQAPTGRITLHDMYIGDLGARTLAEILKQYPNIGILDIKGNNIGPTGFIDIFQALKTNIALRQINLQWNNLCANNNLKALELLFQILSINKSVVHIDLQNNRLNVASAALIANIIRNNPQLRTVDLRWNELGNQGIRLLIAAVAANGYIVSVEIQGNGASDDTIKELNQVLNLNRDNAQDQGPRGSNSQIGQQSGKNKQPLKDMATHLEEERKAVARHLEKLIERERMLGLQYKEEYEEKVGEWKQRLMGNQNKIEQIEKNGNELQQQKNIRKSDIQRMEENIKELQASKLLKYQALEEKLHTSQKNITDSEKRKQEELTEQQRGNFMQLREVDNEWGRKCDQIMDQNRKLDDFNQDLLQQCNILKDQITKFNNSTSTETMEIVEKIKKLVLDEFKEKLNLMESQVEQIDQDRLNIHRKNQETLMEAQKEFRSITEQYSDMLKDRARLDAENRNHQIENHQLELFSQTVGKDANYRNDLEKKITSELQKIKEKEFKINDHESKQLNQINNIFSNDQHNHGKTKEDLRTREEALDKTLRDNERENHRLGSDISRLIEILQANTTKAIFQTFSEHKVI